MATIRLSPKEFAKQLKKSGLKPLKKKKV